jgi:type I restriction enzyme, S subunit
MKNLLEVCSVRTGKRDANHGDLGGAYPFFTCAEKPIQSPTYSFDGDSIILPGNGANVGLVIFYSGKFEAYQRTYVLSEFNCNPRYAYHHLNCFWSRANSSSQYGSATNYIRMGNFEDYRLPIPPLAEQRRIAEVLDRAEALRAKRRATLAQLDSLTQSLFLDLFGDPRKNEKGWPLAPIGSVVSDIMRGAALEPEDFVETGFPVLHKGAIKPNGVISIDTRKKTFAPVEFANANPHSRATRAHTAVNLRDLVPTGPSIGLAADLRDGPFDEYILAQGAYAFRLAAEKMMPEYFVYLSNMPNFRHVLRQNAVGSTQIHIRTPIYFAIQIPCPPIETQRKFARQVRAVDKLMAAQRAALAELEAFFASLQNRAFKGEL